MKNIETGTAFVLTDNGEVVGNTMLLVYRPENNKDFPFELENRTEFEQAGGFPNTFTEQEVRDLIDQHLVREATVAEVELIRAYDPEDEVALDGFEIGDIYVEDGGLTGEELVESGRYRYGYYPTNRAQRPWVLQNPDFIVKLMQGTGPHAYGHEGDILDRIERGELRKLTDDEKVLVAEQAFEYGFIF